MKIGIVFDFHDIFVDSKSAWRKAFKDFDSSILSTKLLDRGLSRRYIAKIIGKEFDKIENRYREYLKPINQNIKLLKQLNKNFKIFLVSRSSKNRLYEDIKKFKLKRYFYKIYSREDYQDLESIFNKIIKTGEFDFIIFFNHDINKFYIKRKVIYCPITLCNSYEEYKDKSFVEHARNKLLYNELSKIYPLALNKNTKDEIKFLRKVFKKYGDNIKEVVDLGCGVGRHSIPLSQLGFSVTGVDISKNILKIAKEKGKKMDLKIKFINQDIRNLKLEENICDSAICMWTTYNYLSTKKDLSNFLMKIHKILRREGILVLDAKNINKLEDIRAYSRTKEDNDKEVFLLIIKRILKNVQNGHYLYFIKNKDNQKIKFFHDEELAKFYSIDEIKQFSKNKFKILDIFGDFDMNRFDPDNSERFILVLKKI